MAEAIKLVAVCVNRRFSTSKPSCAARGSVELADALEQGIKARGLDVKLHRIVCLGKCYQGPTVRFVPGGDFLLGQSLDDVGDILDLLADRLVD